MVLSRGPHRYERVTITLVPIAGEASFRNVPSTFSAVNRTYTWRQYEAVDYMIVPTKISNKEIKIDIFFDALQKGKANIAGIQKSVQSFVKTKIQTEWKGLKLGGISRASAALPPDEKLKRGTIEEILGATLEG
jgi:hypothetical protein